MRGARGGLKDQIKAFREFLIRRKKKKIKENEKLRLKKKKEEEKKKNNNLVSDALVVLNDIEFKLINNEKMDLLSVSQSLDEIKKDKSNFYILDKIEDVKEKVEVEIIFEEIIKPKTKAQVISSNLDNKDENKKIEKFINVTSNIINKTNNEVEINHYLDMVNSLYSKHKIEQSIITNTKLDKFVIMEEQIIENVKVNKNFENSKHMVTKKNVVNIDNDIQFNSPKMDKKNFNNDIEIMEVSRDNDTEILDVLKDKNEELEVLEENNDNNKKDDDLGEIINYIEQDKGFDTKDFDVINKNIQKQVIYNENEINKLKNGIKDIKDIFKEKSGFDRFLEFSSNLFGLSRGLIGKYVFNNSLNCRLNNEILINNSLKGIHRAFAFEKQEVPYIVFESFMRDINDKKDCAIKINDICEDSLNEIRNLKAEFLIKYGDVYGEEVSSFINKIDNIEADLIKRQEEAKKIEKQALEQYNKNYQKVKIRK